MRYFLFITVDRRIFVITNNKNMEINSELLKNIINDVALGRNALSDKYNIPTQTARHCVFIRENIEEIQKMFETDKDLVESNVRYKKQQQMYMDSNRIERKSFREHARVENAVSGYVKGLIDVFEQYPYKSEGRQHESNPFAIGVIHISDVHFNELINIATNKYDFTIASRRLRLFISEATTYFLGRNIRDVFVLFTGDLMNSDRRLDEILAMATNRSKATFISVQILENAIMHLNDNFNVYLAGICGNESRISKDYNWHNDIVSDNYDFTIFNILRYKMRGVDGVTFLGYSDKHEEVVEVNGKHVLLVHGHQVGKDITKDMSKLVRKYANMGVNIHFVLLGHIHETLISDMFGRSSSLCGSNSYSEDALLLVGRASQNCYIFFNTNRIDAIKIDLQDTEDVEAYDTYDFQDAYNPKSLEKAKQHQIILRR